MKLRQMFLALSFSAFALAAGSASAEGTYYVGANGGPLYGTYGCVMSANETAYSECGAKKEEVAKPEVAPPAQQPKVTVIKDCSKCAKSSAAKPAKKVVTKKVVKKKVVTKKVMKKKMVVKKAKK